MTTIPSAFMSRYLFYLENKDLGKFHAGFLVKLKENLYIEWERNIAHNIHRKKFVLEQGFLLEDIT